MLRLRGEEDYGALRASRRAKTLRALVDSSLMCNEVPSVSLDGECVAVFVFCVLLCVSGNVYVISVIIAVFVSFWLREG